MTTKFFLSIYFPYHELGKKASIRLSDSRGKSEASDRTLAPFLAPSTRVLRDPLTIIPGYNSS